MQKNKCVEWTQKILVLLITVAMLFSMLPVSAFAQETKSSAGTEEASSKDNTASEENTRYEKLASAFGIVQPVYIESLEMTNLIKDKYKDLILQNDLLDFDAKRSDYTVVLKNDRMLSTLGETVKLRASGPVTSITAKASNSDREVNFSAKEDERGTYYQGTLRFAQWATTDFTIKVNYGTAVSPRYRHYNIHFITDSETDGIIDTFEITTFKEGKKLEVLRTDEAANGEKKHIIAGTPDKVMITAEAKVKGTAMNLTYTQYGSEPGVPGTQVTIPIESGKSIELTDAIQPVQYEYQKYDGLTASFKIDTQPATAQQGRSYQNSIKYGDYDYGDFRFVNGLEINSNTTPTIGAAGLIQPDGTQGYKLGCYDYSVTLYDRGYGALDNTLTVRYVNGGGTSPYVDLNGKAITNTVASGSFRTDELEHGKHNQVELRVYKDEKRNKNESRLYKIDVNILPSYRLADLESPDDSVYITTNVNDESNVGGNITGFILDGAKTGKIKISAPEGAVLRWDDPTNGSEIENGATIDVNAGFRTLYMTGEVKSEGNADPSTVTIPYMFNLQSSQKSDKSYVDYWPAPGQFVNSDAWGKTPEYGFESLQVSLGGFGGYLTTKFDEPIKNDPSHVGGIDFKVTGNAFGDNSEPANVLVSKDGIEWYTLAGGYHYEDDCIWDYEITYTRRNDDIAWTDNQGESGSIQANGYHRQDYYPLTENYGKFRTEENGRQYGGKYSDGTIPSSYSMKGVLLPGRINNWGYADAAPIKGNTPSTSPYNTTLYFDLDWAVDKDGNPVALDEVNYVKTQNATNLVLDAVGELSAEITEVIPYTQTNSSITRTKPVQNLVINNQTMEIDEKDAEDGIVEVTAYYTDENEVFDINVIPDTVNTSQYTAVIGSESTTIRHYDRIPEHKMTRIITQEGQNEPTIYYITFEKGEYTGLKLDQFSMEVQAGTSKQLTPTFVPEKPEDSSLIWSSSNMEVATVDNTGRVTGVGAGEAIIMAEHKASGAKAMCKAIVGEDVIEAFTEIKLVDYTGKTPLDQLDYAKDGTAFIRADFTPQTAFNHDLTWISSDENIVTIGKIGTKTEYDYAYVHPVNPGTATITATTSTGVTASVDITVPGREKGTAIFAVEKFTIGQGYLIEPMQIEFEEGDTASEIVTRALEQEGYEYSHTGEIGDNFYLSTIKNADNGTFNPPQEIQDMPSYMINVSGVNEKAPDLGEFAYEGQSGWIYHVNDLDPGVGMDGYSVKDGDVIRLQFTLNGLGADLGGSSSGGEEAIPVAKKSALSSRVADWNMNAAYFMNIQSYKDAYDNAINVLNKYMASQEEVDAAAAALPYNEAVPVTAVQVMNEAGEALEEVSLTKGESQQLSAVLEPADASDLSVSWSSDNENVAVVDNNGHITAVGEGEATIRVKANGGEIAQARGLDPLVKSIKVTVKLTDTQAAAKVQEMIASIGEATLDKEAEILNVRAAYDKLSAEAKAQVSNAPELEAAEATLNQRKAPVNTVTTQIQALPEKEKLTLSDQAKVKEVRAAYEALEQDQKDYLDLAVYQKLESAEAQIAILEQQADDQAKAEAVSALIEALPAKADLTLAMKPMVDYAQTAYKNLSEAQKAHISADTLKTLTEAQAQMLALEAEADAKAAQAVIDQIAQLGEITSLDQAKAVAEARGAYEALTEAQKALIGADTLKALEKAEAAIAKLTSEAKDQAAAQAVIDQIAALPSADQLTQEDKAAVEAARAAYNNLSENQRSYVSEDTLKALEAAEAQILKLEEAGGKPEPMPEPTPTPEPTPIPGTSGSGNGSEGSNAGNTSSGHGAGSNTSTGITSGNSAAVWGSLALIVAAAGITGFFVSKRRKAK